MDFRRDDEQKHANEEQLQEEAQTPQTAGSEEQQSEQPAKEPELILKKDTDDQSDLTNKETAAALEDAKETRAAKEKPVSYTHLTLPTTPYVPISVAA